MLNVVVLPAPFGPSSPTISPAPTLTETPLTTRRPRYSFTSFSVMSSSLLFGAVSMIELDQCVVVPHCGGIIRSIFLMVPGGKLVLDMGSSLILGGGLVFSMGGLV